MLLSFLEQFDNYKTSSKTALVCGNTSLSYQELHKRSLMLASKLRSLGVGAGSTAPALYDIYNPRAACHSPWVVIIAERSIDAVVSVIATLMAGGAYVLMEKNAPEAYVRSVIEDTASAVVIRDGEVYAENESVDFRYTFPDENEIACAVFTSGSTGRPKGAVLEHRVINEMLRWQKEYMKPEEMTATAAYAPLSFIAATWEIFFPLANGLTLHILDETVRRDLFALETYIEQNNISYIFLPPNIAEVFTKTYKGGALRYLRVAGGRLKSCGNPCGYEIMYHLGMAENGGSVTFKSIRSAMSGSIPIGKAWSGTKVYLSGDTGEMAVSGPSLFRGYLSRREETASKLTENLFANEDGYKMMYITGDLARIDENGEFVHMGRNDSDIKIRDMKVSPRHVETALEACTDVKECCVTAQALDGENVLIGWVAGNTTDVALKLELSEKLPEYMIPSVFVFVPNLPRNINGKVDRSALNYSRVERETADLEGMSGVELTLAGIFARLLGCPAHSVGADDSFLRLGGDSLKLMQLQAEIAKEFSQIIPYTVLFENPAPCMIAGFLHKQESGGNMPIPPAEPMEAYPLSAPMRQMWLLWRTGQDGGKYTVTAKCEFTGIIDKTRVLASFAELVRRNAILRSRFEERGGNVWQIIEESAAVLLCEKPRRAFDLTKTPLFDISLTEDTLSFTTHHIIADAIGLRVLMEDFWTLYSGNEPQNGVQAHDAAMWLLKSDTTADEAYWIKTLSGKNPAPALPSDFVRSAGQRTASREAVLFNENETLRLREYAGLNNATLFQLFLAAYALLLSELTGGGVVVGVPFSGREHPDTARIIGMFVRTLPVRLDVYGMCLKDALNHTRKRFMDAWEHQGTSVERLSELVKMRTEAQNAFYDVMINYVPMPLPLPDVSGLRPEILRAEYPAALFDLVLDLREEANGLSAAFTYRDGLWKPETIRNWADAFKSLLLKNELKLEREYQTAVKTNDTDAAFDENTLQIRELSLIWEDILNAEAVSPCDDFFSAGGTSLAAIRIESALFERGWLLSASDIFQNPKLNEMAAMMLPLEETDWEDEA